MVAGTYRLKQQTYDIAMKVGAGLFGQIIDARPDLAVCHPETCHWHIEHTGVRTLHRIENLDRAARARALAGCRTPLRDGGELSRALGGRRPAAFLDYDGTLTPMVDRPEDAVISESMRDAVRGLAERCPVCVVSGRDRRVVQDFTGSTA